MLALPALGVWAIAITCIVLSLAYTHTLGAVMQLLARIFNNAEYTVSVWGHSFSVGFSFIGHAIGGLDNAIREALYAGITGSEWAWHRMLHAMAASLQDLGDTIHTAILGTSEALGYLRSTVLPGLIQAYLLPIRTELTAVEKAWHAARPVITKVEPAVTKVVYRDTPHALTKAEEAAIAALVAVPAAVDKTITVTKPAFGHIGRDLDGLKTRVGKLSDLLTVGGIVGLVSAAVFSRLGLGWLKCSNVGKAARSVCGMDAGLLEALLADALVIFGTLSLVEFAETMLAVMDELSGDVLAGWKETKHLQAEIFQGYTGTLG